MDWIIYGTIFAFFGFMFILLKAIEETKEDTPDGTVYMYPGDIDEHSPENLDIDNAIKTVYLRNKLKKIEEERKETKIEDVNLDYDRIDGR